MKTIEYKGCTITKTKYCHYVEVNNAHRYFYQGGDRQKQLDRCKKEVDDFENGLIV